MIPWRLNWIIFWIESADFFLNWIIFWIESWAKQYWIKYCMNHFLAKFKKWIESDWVTDTIICVLLMPKYIQHQTFYSHCAFCQNQTIWNGCIFLEGLHPLLNSLISTRVVYFKPLFLQYKFLIRSITQSTSFISWFISKSDRKKYWQMLE